MPEKAAVIGAGIGGLAVAIRLAAKGYKVDIFEKNEIPGGKMAFFHHDGYRFDTGPSLFTLPQSISELFAISGQKMADHFDFTGLDEICRYFYDDGMVINGFADPSRFAAELHRKAGEDEAQVLAYLQESRTIYELTNPVFITKSLHRFKNYYSPEFLKAYFHLHRLRPFSTLHRINSRYFRHENTVRLFDRFATYNGSNPYKTPATLMVIPHLEHNLGAYFPVKGMYDIARSLAELAEKKGVNFHYNSRVDEISVKAGRVEGLRMNGDKLEVYNIIVSDLDIWYLYRHLLKSEPFPSKWFRHERSTSALIFYWGMQTVSTGLSLHNILFANDYQGEFDCLFNKKTISPDPTVYLFISSKVVRTDAPEGCENWFVMVNTPENCGQDWEKMIAGARTRIEEKILKFTGIEVGRFRKFEFILDPGGIEEKTASYHGSLYGNSSNSMWAAFQRHPNFSRIRGLYLAGGSVHPGGGIPLCLSSAKIVADMIPSVKT
jgi:phytoene desaturase